MTSRLNGKCLACGHIWTLARLPLDVQLLTKFTKLPCPMCHAPKPVMAGKDDLTAENRLHALIRRAHDAMSRRDPDGIGADEWGQLVDDMAKEIGHG